MCAPSRVLFDRSAGSSDVRVSDYRRNRTVRWTWPSKVVTAEGECCKTTATVPPQSCTRPTAGRPLGPSSAGPLGLGGRIGPPPSVVGCREVSPRPPVRASAPPDLLAGGQGQGRPRSPLRTAARRRLFSCGGEVFLHVHCPQDTTEAGKRHHCASCGRPRAGSPPKDGRPARDRVPS